MTTSAQAIGPLTKVTLAITFSTDPADMPSPAPIDVSFIYGVGADGITPFERALYGKSPRESVNLRVDVDHTPSLFGHLACDVVATSPLSPPYKLNATVISVEKADDRELVKAMAKSSQCGAGCDCGCGC